MRLLCDGCRIGDIFTLAYASDAKTAKIQGEPGWVDGQRDVYDIDIAATSPVSRIQMLQVLLRSVFVHCFAVRAREVTKSVPGYALVVAPGGIKFPAVKAPVPRGPPVEGNIHLSTLPQLASAMSRYYYSGKRFGVTGPVTDATGLSGFFNIPFPVALEPGTNLLAEIRHLGLEVKPAPATDTRLQILHIDELRTSCQIGPRLPGTGN
jgi:uncharacterized protein (TIGR03435 family)